MTTVPNEKHQDLTSGGSEIQRKAYGKVAAKRQEGGQSLSNSVMVSITTLSAVARKRAPVDVVLVLHVNIRLMAPENWHHLLVQATRLLIDKLGVNDRLAIVPASLMEPEDNKAGQETERDDKSATTIRSPMKPKFLKMFSKNKEMSYNAVKNSQAMRRNAALMKDLELAKSALFATESDEKVDRAGYIIVISNSNEDLSSMISWRFLSVHAFGFQGAHNARTMCTIASNSESTYAVFDEGGGITQAFAKSIGRITSAVEPLEVKLKCEQDVLLSAISAPRISYFISYDKKVGIIWANAHLTSGAVTNFIVHLEVRESPWTNPASGSLLKVEVKYRHHNNSNFACKVLNESKEVDAEKVRMEAVKIVAEITARDKSDSKQLQVAADKLHTWWRRVEMDYSREAAEAGQLSRLAAEIKEMETRLHNNYLWLEHMLSWRSHQWCPLPRLIVDKKEDTNNDPLLKLRILVMVDGILEPILKNHQGLPVLVHVTAPVEGLAKVKRAPLDVVTVLDVGRGSRMKKRQELVDKAMEFIKTKLSCNDRLAIIFTVTRPAAGLFQRKKKRHSEHAKLLQVVTSSTKVVQQSSQLKMDKTLGRTAVGSRTKLLSDSLSEAVKLLDDRREGDRMGLIILISDIDDASILKGTPSCKYTVHAFSFRDADNARTMYGIATIYRGIYANIDDHQDRITEAFMACLNNITSTIAVNTRVNIVCSHSSDVKLFAIESGQFTSTIDNEKKTGSIFAGALYAGAVRRFVAYLENVREEGNGGLSNMLAVDVTWDTTSRTGSTEAMKGQVQIVRDQDDASTEVMEEIVRLEEVGIVRNIGIAPNANVADVLSRVQELRDMAYKAKMRRIMFQAADLRLRPKGYSSAFAVDEDSLASLVNDKDGPWFSYILSWLSFQGMCEKPPSAPIRPRQGIEEYSQQGPENFSQEEV